MIWDDIWNDFEVTDSLFGLSIWFISGNATCGFEKNIYSTVLGWRALQGLMGQTYQSCHLILLFPYWCYTWSICLRELKPPKTVVLCSQCTCSGVSVTTRFCCPFIWSTDVDYCELSDWLIQVTCSGHLFFFQLQSNVSHIIRMAVPALFCLLVLFCFWDPLAYIMIFYPFTLSLFLPSWVRWLSCRNHIIGPYFLIHIPTVSFNTWIQTINIYQEQLKISMET